MQVLLHTATPHELHDIAPAFPTMGIEWPFAIWVFALIADRSHQENGRLRLQYNMKLRTELAGLHKLLLWGDRILLFGVVCRLGAWSSYWFIPSACGLPDLCPAYHFAHRLYLLYQDVISLDIILIAMRLLPSFSANKHFGVLVIIW